MVGGVLLDVDGVLTVSWRALPGAVRTIGWLREQYVGFRLVTNTSSRSRRRISDLRGDAEMPVGYRPHRDRGDECGSATHRGVRRQTLSGGERR